MNAVNNSFSFDRVVKLFKADLRMKGAFFLKAYLFLFGILLFGILINAYDGGPVSFVVSSSKIITMAGLFFCFSMISESIQRPVSMAFAAYPVTAGERFTQLILQLIGMAIALLILLQVGYVIEASLVPQILAGAGDGPEKWFFLNNPDMQDAVRTGILVGMMLTSAMLYAVIRFRKLYPLFIVLFALSIGFLGIFISLDEFLFAGETPLWVERTLLSAVSVAFLIGTYFAIKKHQWYS